MTDDKYRITVAVISDGPSVFMYSDHTTGGRNWHRNVALCDLIYHSALVYVKQLTRMLDTP